MDSLGIIRQLEQDAGLRAQLRAVLLGEELLDLPELFRQLASRVDQLAEAQARTEAALRDLVLETGRRFEQADVRFDRLEQGLAEVRGRSLESGIRGHPRRYLPRDLAADVGMVEGPSEEALLASLSSDAAAEIAWVGALVEGRSRLDNTSVYFVVEASVRAHVDDLERAARRAMLLAEAGFEARAVVVTRTDPGEHIIGEAHSRGVMLISEPKGVVVPSSPAA